jgi:hypothetical protein
MRKALIVGIDYYEHSPVLYGCVHDAHAVKAVLDRHGDGTINFESLLLTCTHPGDAIRRADLKDHITDLFASDSSLALFYFAGHGHIEASGGYLLATDSARGDEGVSLAEVLTLANRSPSANRIIILDSCHSGIAGTPPGNQNIAALSEGLTVLTASTADQYATEAEDKGVFTSLLVNALNGSAANLTGDITPGSVYAHIDQSLGAWEQRPVFKTNVKQFVSLRRVPPPISLDSLLRIAELFPSAGFDFQLDPTYEPEMKGRDAGLPGPIHEHTLIFEVLQQYNRLGLVVPVEAPHMWHAAMQNKSCRLTALGEHYRRLVEKGRI